MRPGGEKRGNSRNRRARKVWLLANFDLDLGPERCRCWLDLSDGCLVELTFFTVTADRIDPGGSYRRENVQPACAPCQNVQPACAPCQNVQGALITKERRDAWRRYREEADALGIEWDGTM